MQTSPAHRSRGKQQVKGIEVYTVHDAVVVEVRTAIKTRLPEGLI